MSYYGDEGETEIVMIANPKVGAENNEEGNQYYDLHLEKWKKLSEWK